MTIVAVVIAFRDRGTDPNRKANLERVLDWWAASPWTPHVVSDGRVGDAQFSRSRAYNLAAEHVTADVIVYAEADLLVPLPQIEQAITMAAETPGLVVPFDLYAYLSPEDSERVRNDADPAGCTPEKTMTNGRSIGAVNVVSRETLALVGGYTERTEGSWWDDRLMHHAFDVCAGPTRWVTGLGYHLWHVPAFRGDHLTAEDKAATARNKALWQKVRRLKDPERVRAALHG